MNFDFDAIETVEFGVCTRREGEIDFFDVPSANDVAGNLREMARDTWQRLLEVAPDPVPYDPADESKGNQHLFVDAGDELVALIQDVNEAFVFRPGGGMLMDQPSRFFCYFARFTDDAGRPMTGIRLSNEFKGIVRHRNRLMRVMNDTLRMTEDNVFKLDADFDLLVGTDEVRILRPAAFETICRLQQAVRDAVPRNVARLQQSLGFVEFGTIEAYAHAHVPAARLLAGLVTKRTDGITPQSLTVACQNNGVPVRVDAQGQVLIAEDDVVGFLRTLNRNRFNTELIPGEREVYDASGARRL